MNVLCVIIASTSLLERGNKLENDNFKLCFYPFSAQSARSAAKAAIKIVL